MYGEGKGMYRVLVGKLEGKGLLRRTWRRWEDDIKMDLHKWDVRGIDWNELAQDRDRWALVITSVQPARSYMI